MNFFTKRLVEKEQREAEMYLTKREIALTVAWRYLGKWYLWGGDNPQGFDCSGFVIECLKSAGVLPAKGDWTASGLWYKFASKHLVHEPRAGCLVFFRKLTDPSQKIIHVEMCLDDELSIGAMGGGSCIKTIADAFAHDAFIKIRNFREKDKLVVHGFVDPFMEKE